MKSILKVSLAAALVASSVLATASDAFAQRRHHAQYQDTPDCMTHEDLAAPLFIGLVLGAVTGGVGTAVAFTGASVATGAAIGAGGGAVIGIAAHAHAHGNCY